MRLLNLLKETTHHEVIDHVDIHRLDDQLTANFYAVIHALDAYGYETRIVGGTPRDLLLDQSPRDIDLATTALPDEIIWVMQKHKFDLTTKGITHGTIKVVFPGEEYEVTSLSYRVRERNGRLQIQHQQDWRADAERRDFSVNSLSMDLEGNIYDYLGGIKDLEDHRIRFLQPIEEKLADDPVLILRFFKLVSKLTSPRFDPASLKAIEANKHRLSEISPERVQLELSNIHHGENAPQALRVMHRMGIDRIISI